MRSARPVASKRGGPGNPLGGGGGCWLQSTVNGDKQIASASRRNKNMPASTSILPELLVNKLIEPPLGLRLAALPYARDELPLFLASPHGTAPIPPRRHPRA